MNETKDEKKIKIEEGFKTLYGHNKNKQININLMYSAMAQLLDMIIDNPSSEQLTPPNIPYSKARDLNGWSQREIMKIIKGNNLKETALNFKIIIKQVFEADKGELFLHRTSKFFFKKKKDTIESFKDLRALAISPTSVMIIDKLASQQIRNWNKNLLASN